MAESVRATPAGPVTHVLPVHFDEAAHRLTVLRDRFSIKPGDTVVWTFANAPVGSTPWIQLNPAEDGHDLFGPLLALHQTGSAVWGTCEAEEPPGTFSYRAVLQNGHLRAGESTSSSHWSDPATLIVIPPVSGEEKAFTVELDTKDGAQKLVVSPENLEMKGADTVAWRFPPEADGWLPRVSFFKYEGGGIVPNPHLGPFTSMITQAGEVRGTGNTDVLGLYHFEVALVRAIDGEVEWVNSDDPVVDNRGTVIGPDGG
jgi:hypothetical protein